MGIGRFAFTPILPMMTARAGLTAETGATLATANYVGYLAGALAAAMSPRMARSPLVLRASLVAVVATLLAMPLLDNPIHWAIARLLAGFGSALVFVTAVNLMMDQLRHHSPHLAGWEFSGVGVGIAASGFLVLLLPADTDWRGAWWAVGALAAVLGGGAWATHTITLTPPRSAATCRRRHGDAAPDGGSPPCSSATRWKASGTSSRAPSSSPPSNRARRAGWASAPG
jgi:MFS family permease